MLSWAHPHSASAPGGGKSAVIRGFALLSVCSTIWETNRMGTPSRLQKGNSKPNRKPLSLLISELCLFRISENSLKKNKNHSSATRKLNSTTNKNKRGCLLHSPMLIGMAVGLRTESGIFLHGFYQQARIRCFNPIGLMLLLLVTGSSKEVRRMHAVILPGSRFPPDYRCSSSSCICHTGRGLWWCRPSLPSDVREWLLGSWHSLTPSIHRWPFPVTHNSLKWEQLQLQ